MKNYANFQAKPTLMRRALFANVAIIASFAFLVPAASAQVPEAPATPPMKGAAAASSQATPTVVPGLKAGPTPRAAANVAPAMGASAPPPGAAMSTPPSNQTALRPVVNAGAAAQSKSVPAAAPGPQPGAPMGVASAGPRDPFAPADAQAPMPGSPGPTGMQAPGLQQPEPAVQAAQKVNMDCLNPAIKEQGKFVGKVQNKVIYKLGAQYCIEIEEPTPVHSK